MGTNANDLDDDLDDDLDFLDEEDDDTDNDQGDDVDSADDADDIDHLLSIGLFGRVVVDRHIRPFASEGNGHGATDTAVATGDKGLASGQTARAVIAGLAMVRTRLHLAGERRPFLALLLEGVL